MSLLNCPTVTSSNQSVQVIASYNYNEQKVQFDVKVPIIQNITNVLDFANNSFIFSNQDKWTMESARTVLPDISAACFRDYTQINSELNQWQASIDSCNTLDYYINISINESQVFQFTDNQYVTTLYVNQYYQNNSLYKSYSFEIKLSSEIIVQNSDVIDTATEDDYRITLYLNSDYFLRSTKIQMDGKEYNKFYTSQYPDSYQQVTGRSPIIQIMKSQIGTNNFKISTVLEPSDCTDQMIELGLCSTQFFIDEYLSITVQPKIVFSPYVKLTESSSQLTLNDDKIQKVVCDTVEQQFNDGYDIDQTCKQLTITYCDENGTEQIIQINMTYQERNYYLYTYKEGDSVSSIEINSGEVCEIERTRIFTEAKQQYEQNQNSTSNNTNGSNQTGGNNTNNTNGTNGTDVPGQPSGEEEEEEESSNDSIGGIPLGIGLAAGLIGLGLIA